MIDVAQQYEVIITDCEKVMADWEEREIIDSVFARNGIDVVSTWE